MSPKAGASAVKFQKRTVKDLVNFNQSPGKSIGYLSKNAKDIKTNKVWRLGIQILDWNCLTRLFEIKIYEKIKN